MITYTESQDTVITRIVGGDGTSTNVHGSDDVDINLVEVKKVQVEQALEDFHIMSVCMVIITIAVCIIALKNLFSK